MWWPVNCGCDWCRCLVLVGLGFSIRGAVRVRLKGRASIHRSTHNLLVIISAYLQLGIHGLYLHIHAQCNLRYFHEFKYDICQFSSGHSGQDCVVTVQSPFSETLQDWVWLKCDLTTWQMMEQLHSVGWRWDTQRGDRPLYIEHTQDKYMWKQVRWITHFK